MPELSQQPAHLLRAEPFAYFPKGEHRLLALAKNCWSKEQDVARIVRDELTTSPFHVHLKQVKNLVANKDRLFILRPQGQALLRPGSHLFSKRAICAPIRPKKRHAHEKSLNGTRVTQFLRPGQGEDRARLLFILVQARWTWHSVLLPAQTLDELLTRQELFLSSLRTLVQTISAVVQKPSIFFAAPTIASTKLAGGTGITGIRVRIKNQDFIGVLIPEGVLSSDFPDLAVEFALRRTSSLSPFCP